MVGAAQEMTVPSDERELVRRAQQRDRGAFAEIYERYHSTIYTHIYYRVGDPSTAEDLTSEVFVRVVGSIDGFVYRDRPLLTWLYTIARNLIIDHRRRAGRATMLPLDERLENGSEDVERAAELALSRRRLAVALDELTDDQRHVIILRFIEGRSLEEVAEIVGKSVGAVKALQHRALDSLRRVLSPQS